MPHLYQHVCVLAHIDIIIRVSHNKYISVGQPALLVAVAIRHYTLTILVPEMNYSNALRCVVEPRLLACRNTVVHINQT